MFEVSDNLLVETVDGQPLLLDLTSNRYYNLNQVGSYIVDYLREGCDRDAITQRLVLRFADQEPERLRADAEHFISQLLTASLIQEL